MNIERMNHLIEILENVEKEKKNFDMAIWYCTEPNFCGTVACALGYAAIDPIFNNQGLELSMEQTPIYRLGQKEKFPAKGFEAGSRFFDITYVDATYLFDDANYKNLQREATPRDVIDRIKLMLAQTPKELENE